MRHSSRRLLVLASALALAVPLVPAGVASAAPPDYRVLVFWGGEEKSATNQAGFKAIQQLGKDNNFAVEATDDPARFVDHQLSRFRAVVFLNTAGDPLNSAQKEAFERYFRNGGGFVGIGSAIETGPEWDFLTEILGTRATSKTEVQPGTIKVADRVHDASKDLPEYWTRTDAWYN
ncbi:MAG: ThuA domain-containing protein, partial [Pseudonocardiaceae bacterium]